MAADILIVDDEADIRELVAGLLEDEGHVTRTAGDAAAALRAIAERRPHLVFLDIWLQGSSMDGLQTLEAIKADYPDVPVVMISGHGNIETAVSAIRRGAYDYIEKPFKADRLILVAERALEAFELKRQVKALKERSGDEEELVGHSSAINQLRHQIDRIAPTNSRVMIFGPSGSGKEIVARALHARSLRAKGPFVALNAATMLPENLEAELFGVAARPGERPRIGALEEANGGVLYLDEVADMPRETQGRILRVLTDQAFERVGGNGLKVQVDVRVISSSSRDLEREIAEGRFREDLFHRLAVVIVRVPGLAERRDDIPPLVEYYVRQLSRANGLAARRIAPDAMVLLQAHDWPGNLRQLRNNIERLMILARGEADAEVTADLLPAEIGSMLPSLPTTTGGEHLMALPLRDAREVFEREYLTAQITRFGGNISRTAEFVGMERSALHRKLKSLGVG